jgi:hypothetical protein
MVVSVNFLGFHRERVKADRIQIPMSNEMRVADVLCYIQQKYPDLFLVLQGFAWAHLYIVVK